ncbi:MAG: sulfatase [Puniceicoccaceae bacterium]
MKRSLLTLFLSTFILTQIALGLNQPNIVLIYVDDLGYGDLGCYGSEKNDTPHVDKMASDGMRFTDYYSASPVCTPSRAALLSGCYPGRIGFDAFGKKRTAWVLFPGYAEGLHPGELLLPEYLKWHGYATAIVGKWHLGDQVEHLPTRHGFDSYYGIPYSNDMAIMPRRPKSPPMPLLRDEEVIAEQPKQAPLIQSYTEEAVTFIRDNQDRLFFLYFPHMHVHLPHYVMDPFMSASRNGIYGAALAAVDWSTGVIMAELERLGLEENTIVIFTSDNGSREDEHGGSNGALNGKKGTTWEGGQRVPCIVKWPAEIKAGSTSSELVTAMDFYPTIASILGQPLDANPIRDGHDVSPIWRSEVGAKSPYDAFFYYLVDELQAVRSGDWKLRYTAKGRNVDMSKPQLFNLAKDIGEQNNVAAEHPEIVNELTEKMKKIGKAIGDGARDQYPGTERRPHAVTEDPKPLTEFDPDYPYMEPSYLLDQAG